MLRKHTIIVCNKYSIVLLIIYTIISKSLGPTDGSLGPTDGTGSGSGEGQDDNAPLWKCH